MRAQAKTAGRARAGRGGPGETAVQGRVSPAASYLTVRELLGTPHLGLELYSGSQGLERPIRSPRVRAIGFAADGTPLLPGRDSLAAAGPRAAERLGRGGVGEGRRFLRALAAQPISGLVLSRSRPVPEGLVALSREAALPLLLARESLGTGLTRLGFFLRNRLGAEITVHGVLVQVFGVGVLILGPSAIGKSESALELVTRGHRLIADDMVIVHRGENRALMGSGSGLARYHMEIRGIGIIDVKELYGVAAVLAAAEIELIVELEPWKTGGGLRPHRPRGALPAAARHRRAAPAGAGDPRPQHRGHPRGRRAQPPAQEAGAPQRPRVAAAAAAADGGRAVSAASGRRAGAGRPAATGGRRRTRGGGVSFLVITGLSGSGKSAAVKALEDQGAWCVDNLPVALLPRMLELARGSRVDLGLVVLGMDIRERRFVREFPRVFRAARARGIPIRLLFFEASEEVLVRRYSETRRVHPLGGELPLIEAIREERRELEPLRALADEVIDTSRTRVRELRERMLADRPREARAAGAGRHGALLRLQARAARRRRPRLRRAVHREPLLRGGAAAPQRARRPGARVRALAARDRRLPGRRGCRSWRSWSRSTASTAGRT